MCIRDRDFTGADKQEAIKNGTKFRFYAVRDGEYQECWLTVTGLSVVSIETEADADAEIFGGSAYFCLLYTSGGRNYEIVWSSGL